MKIGIDLSIAGVNQAGTGIYIQRLVAALRAANSGDEFRFFSVNQQWDMSQRKTLRTRLDTLYRDLFWMHALLPLKAQSAEVDLLHLPANIIPLHSPCPVVVTILDTILFRIPGSFPAWQRRYFNVFGKRSACKAEHILTISEQSRQDIIHLFGVPPEKVTVVYLAAAPEFRVILSDEVQAMRQRYELGRFILAVGTMEPRKNLNRVLEALARLKQAGLSCQLIHVGSNGWLVEDIQGQVARLGIRENIRFLGRLPLAELVALYNAAEMLVYPSLYEGFGLQVLEAMACGCPVVTSNISSLPEVAGDAALQVDPYRADSIADAIRQVWEDASLAAELRQRGLERARGFTWERTARETLQVYHAVKLIQPGL